MPNQTVDDLIRRLLREWERSSLRVRLTNPKKANRHHDRALKTVRELAHSHEGREALAKLMDAEDPEVRTGAATYCLYWYLQKAKSVLREVAQRDDLLGFEAMMTLSEFEAGNLFFSFWKQEPTSEGTEPSQ